VIARSGAGGLVPLWGQVCVAVMSVPPVLEKKARDTSSLDTVLPVWSECHCSDERLYVATGVR
jgi:hypothetical protein